MDKFVQLLVLQDSQEFSFLFKTKKIFIISILYKIFIIKKYSLAIQILYFDLQIWCSFNTLISVNLGIRKK